jgi:hypothetical protein
LKGDHLQISLPKFHTALELPERVRGMLQLLDKLRRLPLLCFLDCADEVLVLHLDGKTSQKAARGKNPGTAIPIHQQRDGVNVKFQPCEDCTTAP